VPPSKPTAASPHAAPFSSPPTTAEKLAERLAEPLPDAAGIGPRRRARLAARIGPEMRRLDALHALPSRLDTTALTPGTGLRAGQRHSFLFEATGAPRPWGRRGRLLPGRVDATDVALRWHRAPANAWLARLARGGRHRLSGVLTTGQSGELVCDHPRAVAAETPERVPRQPGLDATTALHLRAVVAETLDAWPAELDSLAATTRARLGLPSLRDALAVLHGLVDGCTETARRRLALEEWLAFRRDLADAERALDRRIRPIRATGRLAAALRRRLPFTPTSAQDEVWAEIRADLGGGRRLMRLVHGDVGSGKTAVASFAACDAVELGRQVAVVAPSEALAAQHAQTLDGWLRPLGVETALVTGKLPPGRRDPLLQALARHQVNVAIGTHALLEPTVRFADLGLVVVDEQHRFGVHQRLTLAAKGRDAHLLLLTATPIPRSLALMLEGTLAVSRLANRPGLGANVTTRAVGRDQLPRVIDRLIAALDAGARAFWVCASIAGTEHEVGALARFRHLAERLPDRAALVTGRMAPVARDEAIAAFRAGSRPLLVATTVVEVGIDVPDASIIVVEGAEQFGLAQLHQLRGRVGRAGQEASCLLVHDVPLSAAQYDRLDLLRRCRDGLALAEADLVARGGGDVLGSRQSGAAALRFLDLARDGPVLAGWRSVTADGALDPRVFAPPQPTVTGGLVAG